MDQNDFEARCAARLISQIEGIALKAVLHERRRWAEAYQALQNQLEELRSDNVRLNIQVQSHQLESTNRALWLKRKSDFDALDTRPTKLSRHEDPPSQSFAPPTPSSFRGLSSDRDDEAEGSTAASLVYAPFTRHIDL
ncbi:hypothetical protein FRC09_012468 [Ceratobasidium sp. 395]|nr:hypothetical protein FRC09_012468 [Ceratobasidium sp. 395]